MTRLEQYSAGQMSYDLRRLVRKGIICRVAGSQRCYLTPYGWRLARFYARLEARVFRPALTAMNAPPIGSNPPIEQSAANHRYRTASIHCSGISRSQSSLKPRPICHTFLQNERLARYRHVSNRPRPRPRSRLLWTRETRRLPTAFKSSKIEDDYKDEDDWGGANTALTVRSVKKCDK